MFDTRLLVKYVMLWSHNGILYGYWGKKDEIGLYL